MDMRYFVVEPGILELCKGRHDPERIHNMRKKVLGVAIWAVVLLIVYWLYRTRITS